MKNRKEGKRKKQQKKLNSEADWETNILSLCNPTLSHCDSILELNG